MILAEAGLQRLGLANRITQRLPLRLMLPAVGQGAWPGNSQRRCLDASDRGALDHPSSHAAVLAERAMLAAIRAAVWRRWPHWSQSEPTADAHRPRASRDGDRMLESTQEGPAASRPS